MTKQATIEKLSLNTISEAVSTLAITDARQKIQPGAKIGVSGVVLTKATRHEHLRLYIQPDNKLTVFAEFPDSKQVEEITKRKIKKGSKIRLTGNLISFGFASVCLTNCEIR